MRILLSVALAALLVFQIHHNAGQSVGDDAVIQASNTVEGQDVPQDQNFNLPLKTTELAQIWTDHLWRDGNKVQQNALTGHWRLIDANNYRHAWGSKPQCIAALDERCPAVESGSAKHRVILLHGLMRTSSCMKSLETRLAADGFPHAVRFSYASTRASIGDHAAALREVLENLPENDTFSFVGHSMGNIVVRHLIGDLQADGDPQQILSRCESMVMLGPPNQGAMIAERLAPTRVFGWVTGEGGMELGAKWKTLAPKLATPPFPFHIIAGDVITPVANPLVDGDGDFVVSLDEARLEGAASFTTVPVLHSFLMDNEAVMEKTVALLDDCERSSRFADRPAVQE
ncbi:putative lipase [Stieleria sp. TO1_6]|uniref:esterase/lipase family protein n=1 Tax=Stieleria tagensis TaxID=2956795 RepID=UPI00209AD2E0|nr:alpha/beta hydrolase family protein [Stieleria tagensis]MCO8123804.1 putative lipase [Stieleria tagensis]